MKFADNEDRRGTKYGPGWLSPGQGYRQSWPRNLLLRADRKGAVYIYIYIYEYLL